MKCVPEKNHGALVCLLFVSPKFSDYRQGLQVDKALSISLKDLSNEAELRSKFLFLVRIECLDKDSRGSAIQKRSPATHEQTPQKALWKERGAANADTTHI